VHELATKAGVAADNVMRQQQADRLQLQDLQQQHDMRKMEFMQSAQEQARAEELQYQMLLTQNKRNIDMQAEMAQYARSKQMLQQTMNMINDSNEFDDRQKEELKLQATSKYAGVGTGLTPGSFEAGTLEKELLKGAYNTARIKYYQDEVSSGRMNPLIAQQGAIGEGLGNVDFYTDVQLQNPEMIENEKRRSRILRDKGKTGLHREGDDVVNAYGAKVPKTDPAYTTFAELEKEEMRVTQEAAKLRARSEEAETGFSKSRSWGKMSHDEQTRWLQTTLPNKKRLMDAYNMGYTGEQVYEAWQKLLSDNAPLDQRPDESWKGPIWNR
jgi:hypothetical protein